MPRFREGDKVRVREEADSTSPPSYLIGRSGTIVEYTGASMWSGAEEPCGPLGEERPEYRVRFLRMYEDEQAEHRITEHWLEPIVWARTPQQVKQIGSQISAQHGGQHLVAFAEARLLPWDKNTEVNHKEVAQACAALANGQDFVDFGVGHLVNALDWLRENDPDWHQFEAQF